MTPDKVVALLGLLTGVAASVLLTFSLTRFVSAVVLSINALDVTLQSSLAPSGDIPVFMGLEKHLERGMRSNKGYTVVGFALLGVSFALQIVALMMSGG